MLNADTDFYAEKLPERIIVFGINTMPPLFLAFLHGLSKHCQLHLFLLNPSQDYWADIPSKRARLKQEPEEQYDSHPLLSSLGQQRREFQALLLEQNVDIDLDVNTFESAEGKKMSVARLKVEGLWLSGVLGDLEFERQNADISEFSNKINTKNLGERIEDVVIDLHLDGCRLVGKLSNCHENGGLFYRHIRLKGKDFMGALLHHLVINQVASQSTFLFSQNDKEPALDELIFSPKLAKNDLLIDLLEIYRNGLQHPEAFFTKATFAYLTSKGDALKAAKTALTYAFEQNYELELQRFFTDENAIDRLLNEGFERQCETFLPIWKALLVRE